MQAVKNRSWTSTSTPDDVFTALLGAVQNGSFEIFAVNNEHRKLLFTSGKTMLSWGQEYIAEVTAVDGRTTVGLVCGGVDGRPRALLDPWKNGKAADKVIAAVKSVLDGTTSAPVEPVASFATLEDGSTRPWTEPEYPQG